MQLDHLQLVTQVRSQLAEFYTHNLQLPTVVTPSDTFTCKIGASTLTFTDAAPQQPACYHLAFNIPEHQFAEANTWLVARVPLVTDATGADTFYFDAWNAHACYFYDPAGNLVEFIARHDLPSQGVAPFSSASLLSISEVGLVVDDVPATAKVIQTETGCAVYRGVVNDLFTPLGNEHGLLIVVQAGRGWFPTARDQAVPAPVRAAIVSETGTRFHLMGPPYHFVTAR